MSRLRRLPACILTALAAAALLVAAGCGGGSGSSERARELTRQTFRNGQKVTSGRIAVALRVDAQGVSGLRGPLTATLSGPFERRGAGGVPRFAFTLRARVGGQSLSAGATSTGARAFLALQGRAYALPPAALKAFRSSFSRAQSATRAGGSGGGDPLPWLTDAKVVGEEEVAGVTTEHVAGDVDVGKLLEAVGRAGSGAKRLSDDQRRQVQDAVRDPRFEFWTGKQDKLLRRVRVGFAIDVPEAEQAKHNGLRSADVRATYTIAELNRPQTVRAPAHPQPLSVLAGQLRAGGLLGLAASSGQGGRGAASAHKLRRYSACLRRAGADTARAQACASLLR